MIATSKFDFSNEEYDYMLSKAHLNKIEKEIIEFKREGYADIDIAMELDLCRNTIVKYKLKAYDKMIKAIIKKAKRRK